MVWAAWVVWAEWVAWAEWACSPARSFRRRGGGHEAPFLVSDSDFPPRSRAASGGRRIKFTRDSPGLSGIKWDKWEVGFRGTGLPAHPFCTPESPAPERSRARKRSRARQIARSYAVGIGLRSLGIRALSSFLPRRAPRARPHGPRSFVHCKAQASARTPCTAPWPGRAGLKGRGRGIKSRARVRLRRRRNPSGLTLARSIKGRSGQKGGSVGQIAPGIGLPPPAVSSWRSSASRALCASHVSSACARGRATLAPRARPHPAPRRQQAARAWGPAG